jgi:hypothetical protein
VELLGLPVHSFSDRAELQRMLEKELAALRRQLIMERYPLSWLRAESKAMTLRSDLPLVQPAHREDRLPVLLGKYPHGVRGFTHSHIIQSILVGTPLTNIIDGAISTHRGTVDGHLVVQREQIGSCDTEIHVMPNGVLWLLLYLARDQVEALMRDNGDTVFTAALAFIEPVFVEPIYVFLSSISQMRIRWLSDVSMSVLDFSVHPGAPIGSIGD